MAEWKTVSVLLDYPIKRDGASDIVSVTMREPDVEAMEAVEVLGLVNGQAPTMRQTRCMIVAVSDLTDADAKRLHMKDVEKLSENLDPLFSGETDQDETISTPSLPSSPTP